MALERVGVLRDFHQNLAKHVLARPISAVSPTAVIGRMFIMLGISSVEQKGKYIPVLSEVGTNGSPHNIVFDLLPIGTGEGDFGHGPYMRHHEALAVGEPASTSPHAP